MKHIAALLLILYAIITPVSASTVQITADYGGQVSDYIRRWKEYNLNRTHVIIDGMCASACARYMTLPNVCATSRGWFYFHGMTGSDGRLMLQESIDDSMTWETRKAVALERKYGAFAFHIVKTPPAKLSVRKEDGVYIVHLRPPSGEDYFQKFLKVRANKLVPRC
jgi:hypothetical protein